MTYGETGGGSRRAVLSRGAYKTDLQIRRGAPVRFILSSKGSGLSAKSVGSSDCGYRSRSDLSSSGKGGAGV